MRFTVSLVALSLLACLATTVMAAETPDNTLSAQEKADGWQLLFNGKNLEGWKCNNGKEIATEVENGAIVPYKSGGYIVINEKQFGDFIFKCDVLWEAEHCNSGIFFRVENPADPVNTGFEIQVMSGTGTGKHEMGAIYDLVATKKNASKGTGKWNSFEIKCQGPHISVTLNGEEVAALNADDFDKPGLSTDGAKHKYKLNGQPRAVKDFARSGYLGFQDHGQKVWYKNVKIKEL